MKYECPHCGAKSFSPLLKARCGGYSSAGKPCPECGKRCVNGKASLAVKTVLRLTALIMIIWIYLVHTTFQQILIFGVIPFVLSLVLGFVFDMFFGKLVEAVKRT